jgi:hypothetical protein
VADTGRRRFLAQILGLGALGAGAALGGAAVAKPYGHVRPHPGRVLVYRLSTHQRRSCGACKAHGANRFYQTRTAADADRAHPGCNCSIVKHPLPRGRVVQMFREGDVFDRRSRRKPKKKPPVAKRKPPAPKLEKKTTKGGR